MKNNNHTTTEESMCFETALEILVRIHHSEACLAQVRRQVELCMLSVAYDVEEDHEVEDTLAFCEERVSDARHELSCCLVVVSREMKDAKR